jgi:adenylate cyclase
VTRPGVFVERLVAGALDGRRDDELLGTFCEDLLAHGVPILRGVLGAEFLHPTYAVRLLRWIRGQGAEGQTFDREPEGAPEDEGWLTSPLYRLKQQQGRVMHRRIDAVSMAEFPLFAEFAALGGTDYVGLRQPVGRGAVFGEVDEVFASWVTDRPSGFSDGEVALLERLQPHLVLAVAAVGNVWIGRALLETYLGRDAARRVLAGNIVRGRTETIRAVIWYSDLHGFTRLTDTLPAAEILALLNAYCEPVVEAITQAGGEVLKFMGDGVLAIFGGRDPPEACEAALRARRDARAATAALSRARAARGAPVTQPYLALHEGEVLYGNVGAPARLDFTVLGPAVNEAARIAALCRSLDQSLIVSDAFARACGPARERLVGLGRFALRGVARAQMLWTLDAEA